MCILVYENTFYRYKFTLDGEDFFQTYQDLENHGENIIFGSAYMVESLVASKEVHMDATFQTLPNMPQIYQLLTIHFIYNDHVSYIFVADEYRIGQYLETIYFCMFLVCNIFTVNHCSKDCKNKSFYL